LTDGESKTGLAACMCDSGFFARWSGDNLTCGICPVGSSCDSPGATLEQLPLDEGYWRAHADTTDVRRCPGSLNGSACLTGCRHGTTGPYCNLCEGGDDYFDWDKMECQPCRVAGSVTPLAVIGGVIFFLGCALCLCRYRRKRRKRQHQHQQPEEEEDAPKKGKWLQKLLKLIQRRLATKIKILFSFYQVLTKVGETYSVIYPPSVERTLEVFAWTNLELDGLGLPLVCMGLGSFASKLLFLMAAPFGVVFLFGVALLCRRRFSRRPGDVERGASERESGVVNPDLVSTIVPDLELLQHTVAPKHRQRR